jgi:hypothetical protein
MPRSPTIIIRQPPPEFSAADRHYAVSVLRRIRSATMDRGSEDSWAMTEKAITAGIEWSYKSPVVVLPTNQPAPYPV